MGPFEILETDPFYSLFEKLDRREQEWIRKIKEQLKTNPFAGKPLRFDWFREKKFENKRLYFFVSTEKKRILLLAFGPKKEQQKTIDIILRNREKYWKEISES